MGDTPSGEFVVHPAVVVLHGERHASGDPKTDIFITQKKLSLVIVMLEVHT